MCAGIFIACTESLMYEPPPKGFHCIDVQPGVTSLDTASDCISKGRKWGWLMYGYQWADVTQVDAVCVPIKFPNLLDHAYAHSVLLPLARITRIPVGHTLSGIYTRLAKANSNSI